MPLLRDAANKWWFEHLSECASRAVLFGTETSDIGALREMFALAWEAGAQWSAREIARDMPAVERFTELLILLGDWENESRTEEVGTGSGGTTRPDPSEHAEDGL